MWWLFLSRPTDDASRGVPMWKIPETDAFVLQRRRQPPTCCGVFLKFLGFFFRSALKYVDVLAAVRGLSDTYSASSGACQHLPLYFLTLYAGLAVFVFFTCRFIVNGRSKMVCCTAG